MGKRTYIRISFISLIAVILLSMVAAAIRAQVRTTRLSDDYQYLYQDAEFAASVSIPDLPVVKQDISCGYAVLEMVAQWAGKDVTEESLYQTYGKVVTSTGKSFEKEMNQQFPEYKTTMYRYETNAQMLEKIYHSLSKGIPVPFEWAAQTEGTWTLHYSLITGLDFKADEITVLNPYGFTEVLSMEDFLGRTSYHAYENMPLFLKLGFMFDVFEKNTIFIMEPASC